MSTSLDPFIDDDLDLSLEDEQERERFRIDNDHTASWALRKMWKAERELNRLNENYEETVAILVERFEEACKPLASDLRFFESLLADYHRRLVEEGKADKTYRLPAGELVSRKTPDTVDVSDFAALQDYAEGADHLNLVRIKVEADKRAILAAVKETGETIPGVVLKTGEVRYSAKPFDIGLVGE